MKPDMLPYPAMTADEAMERYGRIFELRDAVPCDLPAHRFSTAELPDDKALCSVPFAIGTVEGYINFYPVTTV